MTKIRFLTSCCYRTRPSWRAEEETYATVRDDHLDGEGRELEVVVDQNPPEDEDHYQTPKLSRCNNQWFGVFQLEIPTMHNNAGARLGRVSVVWDPDNMLLVLWPTRSPLRQLLTHLESKTFKLLDLMFRNKGS